MINFFIFLDWFHSEFEKIPSTVSAPEQTSPQSIFFVDREAPDPHIIRRQRKYKAAESQEEINLEIGVEGKDAMHKQVQMQKAKEAGKI